MKKISKFFISSFMLIIIIIAIVVVVFFVVLNKISKDYTETEQTQIVQKLNTIFVDDKKSLEFISSDNSGSIITYIVIKFIWVKEIPGCFPAKNSWATFHSLTYFQLEFVLYNATNINQKNPLPHQIYIYMQAIHSEDNGFMPPKPKLDWFTSQNLLEEINFQILNNTNNKTGKPYAPPKNTHCTIPIV